MIDLGPSRYPPPGTLLLGKYEVESLIGIGGMGAVVRARHLALDEPVAIKCLLPEMHHRSDLVARFLREARSAVKLKNDHVTRVLDVGRLDDGTPYIVMEYLSGHDLGIVIKRFGPQPPARATDLVLQACEAIAEAHSLGIIHRDIKPANFVLTGPIDDAPMLKVLDFGIATAPEGTSELTTTDSAFGTPAYMAPEQMRSSRTADERSDIWSLGVVLYELLEGRRPFRAETGAALVLAVGMDPPAPITVRGVPAALSAIALRCLEKKPDDRFQTVAQLAAELVPFASDPGIARASAEECQRMLRRSTPRRERGEPTPPAAPPTVHDPVSITSNARSRRRVVIATTAAAGIAIGIVAITIATADRGTAPHASLDPPHRVEPVVTPIPPDAEVVAVVETPPVDAAVVVSTAMMREPKPVRKIMTKPAPKPVTRQTVAERYRGVKRDYDLYKQRFGARLDQEWMELTTFIQFRLAPENFEEAVQRIDAFRSKVHEALLQSQ